MPRMRIMIDVDVPQFNKQGDRSHFDRGVLDKAQRTFPDAVRVKTYDLQFARELLSEQQAADTDRIRLVPIDNRS